MRCLCPCHMWLPLPVVEGGITLSHMHMKEGAQGSPHTCTAALKFLLRTSPCAGQEHCLHGRSGLSL